MFSVLDLHKEKSKFAFFLWAFLFGTCIGTVEAKADIFVFTDESGTPHFSDVPSDSRYTLFMHDATSDVQVAVVQVVPSVSNREFGGYSTEIKRAASFYQVDEALLHAVIAIESGYNARNVSRKGAVGLMQLMPDTARRFKVKNSFDPAQNILGGAQYLSNLMVQFDNNIPLALAAYNAGENNVRKYGGHIPPFPETRAYVRKVMDFYQRYR